MTRGPCLGLFVSTFLPWETGDRWDSRSIGRCGRIRVKVLGVHERDVGFRNVYDKEDGDVDSGLGEED